MFHCFTFKLLKHWSWMQTQQTQNSFPGPKRYRDFRETGPWCQIHLRWDLTRKQLFLGVALNASFSTLYQPISCRRKNIEIGANKRMKIFFSLTCAICLDSYVIARDLCGLLIINIFSLYVLFPIPDDVIVPQITVLSNAVFVVVHVHIQETCVVFTLRR